MELNFIGLIAAVSAFLGIWLGHVSVRVIEARSRTIWKPTLVTVMLGLAFEYAALTIANRSLSTICGILGPTVLWDAFEITRQARRIRKGHAPANPNNPRHAAILAESGSQATTLDLLKRDPIGKTVNADEAIELVAGH